MTAEIVSVGTELLLGQIIDTHAPTMARIFAEVGIGCTRRSTIGDNMERVVGVLKESLSRADLVVTIGGLGPTMDDLTRDAIAVALDDELERVPEVEERLRRLISQRNLRWSDSFLRQADKPKSGRQIDNPFGTAPGLICEKNGKVVIALPGPKGEFEPMAKGPVKQYLSQIHSGQTIHSRVLRIVGMGESQVEDMVRELMSGENPTVAPYAHPGEVHLRLTARAATPEEADRLIDPVEQQIRAILGNNVFGIDDTSLEKAILDLLVAQDATVAVAESMTAGGLGARITTVPGASQAFLGGVIVYTSEMKTRLLGVPEETLAEDGPVSERTAMEMAERVRSFLGATYGLSITGNAGPTADKGERPVGLVYIACAGPRGTKIEELRTRNEREEARRRATQVALGLLRNELLGS